MTRLGFLNNLQRWKVLDSVLIFMMFNLFGCFTSLVNIHAEINKFILDVFISIII